MWEYVKLHWKHDFEDEPVFIFYEVNIDGERLAKRSIEFFKNGKTKNIDDLYEGVIEITPIPRVEEFNSGIWGEEFFASLVTEEVFENVWNERCYQDE